MATTKDQLETLIRRLLLEHLKNHLESGDCRFCKMVPVLKESTLVNTILEETITLYADQPIPVPEILLTMVSFFICLGQDLAENKSLEDLYNKS